MTSTGDADGTNAAFNFHAGHLSMQIELEKVRSRVQRHVVRRGEDVSRADRCASALCNHSEATFGLGPRVRGREHHEKAHGPASGLPRDARPVTDVTDVDCSSHELVTPPGRARRSEGSRTMRNRPYQVLRRMVLSASTVVFERTIPIILRLHPPPPPSLPPRLQSAFVGIKFSACLSVCRSCVSSSSVSRPPIPR